MDFNNTLHKLGFTPIEATVFITLCKHGALTGYEVAKLTGVSRSNIYSALYSLQEKGKCQIADGETTKYIAISKEELILSTKRDMAQTLSELEQFYPAPIEVHEPYVTIKGYDNTLNKIKNSILLCKSHLYLLCASSYIDLLRDELLSICSERRITIICESPIDLDEKIIVYNRHKEPHGIHLIIDTEFVVTGDLEVEHAQCLFTTNHSLVRLMRESFVTELDMIALKKH